MSAYKLKPGRESRASRIASTGVIVSSGRSAPGQLLCLSRIQRTCPGSAYRREDTLDGFVGEGCRVELTRKFPSAVTHVELGRL